MVKSKESYSCPKGPVIIKTTNSIFDCIGLVLSAGCIKDYRGHTIADYYNVKVYKYLYTDFSSKEQKYYFDEVIKFLPCGDDIAIAELLYTGD